GWSCPRRSARRCAPARRRPAPPTNPGTGCVRCARRRARALLAPDPLPQLDRIPVRIADLGARILGPLHRPPGGRHAFRVERAQRRIHVVDFQREALPAEALLAAAQRQRFFGIAHQLNGRAAELEVDEIQRTVRRAWNALPLAYLEAEHVGVESDRAL